MGRARVGRPRLERAARDLLAAAASDSGGWPIFALTRPVPSAPAGGGEQGERRGDGEHEAGGGHVPRDYDAADALTGGGR